MTTGRINQVTISERTNQPKPTGPTRPVLVIKTLRRVPRANTEPSSLLHFFVFATLLSRYEVLQSTASGINLQTVSRGTTLSTIPVLLTLLNFSAAQKSSRSLSSLKIMIHTASQLQAIVIATSFTHLFDCVLRDWYNQR
jgi:hypothetical protein